MAGRLYVGTSGFAYPDWAPLFYPTAARAGDLLGHYAARLPAVELNNTFYQQPRPERIAAWLAQTPSDFRFVVKAQRGGSVRAFGAAAAEALAWLTPPYRLFGKRLGAVLFRVPGSVPRDDDRLAALLASWPRDLPLALELQHASWRADEVFDLLHRHAVAFCLTELDEKELPADLPRGRPFLYLRLRRSRYDQDELDAWADRLAPRLADGLDCFVFFRHDATGEAALNALSLRRRLVSGE